MVGVKFLVLFVLITTAVIITTVKSVPLKSASENNVSAKSVQSFLRKLQLSSRNIHALGKHQAATKTLNEEDNRRNFRLPNNTQPLSYSIRLSTEIHSGDFGFQGHVSINIKALENTNNITLHSRHSVIERIDLFNSDGTVRQEDVNYTYDSEVEFLVITLNEDLEDGEELTIDIAYTGFLSTDLTGFFRTSYTNPDTDQVTWLASTYFHPVNARHAFPCYDEPRYRTPIDLQIRHNREYHALSTMNVAEVTVDGEYATTAFERTLPIPVFILAFAITDFDFVQNTDSDLPMRVYARPSAIAAGQADDALRLGEINLRNMERLFNMTFTLPKSDQIAFPQFNSGSDLYWGLITYRENQILQINDDIDAAELRMIRVAHEYAHIFFGNLVSPESWAYLWLSEGISTLYEIVLNWEISPGNDWWSRFLIDHYDTAITIDVNGLTPALNEWAETPEEILAKFNFVTYMKAAVILRMVGDAITRSTFEKGLSYYLMDNQLRSASPDDLYAGMQRAFFEDHPGYNVNMRQVMSPWFEYEGFPVVTVRRSEEYSGGLFVSQEGFRTLHNELFGIPINFATASNPNFENVTAQFWLAVSELDVPNESLNMPFDDDDWIVLNLRDTAYYITNYEDELWNRIIDALNNDHEIIHSFNRGTFFADFHRFIANNFDVRATIFLRLMESLPIEFDPHVWNRAAPGLRMMEVRLRSTPFHSEHLRFVRELLSRVYGETSFDDDRMATNLINEWSCLSGVQECLDDSLEILIEVMETGNTDFEFDYQCNGLRAANETIWTEFYYSVVDSTSTDDRSTALRDLLCTENGELLYFYVQQVLNGTNSLLPTERAFILTSAAVQHETSYYLVLDIIAQSMGEVHAITSLPSLLLELARVTNSDFQAEGIFSLLEEVAAYADEAEAYEQIIYETLRPNLDFTNRNYLHLTEWYEERNPVAKV